MSDEKKVPSKGGQGLRGLDSTTFFRITNFELFVKPNKYIMGAGIVSISLCFGYIFYINWKSRNDPTKSTYIALAEDGSQYIHERKSRWQ